MEPIPLNDSSNPYSTEHQETLLGLAGESIAYGLEAKRPLPVDVEKFPQLLRQDRACFVTLRIEGRLRGCMGSLTAKRPLVQDVAGNAYSAASFDPRFTPVTSAESKQLDIHLSILGDVEPMEFNSQADLFDQIRPGIDGLILRDGKRTGTLLPAVWENLPSVEEFWSHLQKKAGLPEGYWSGNLVVSRYSTVSFGH